MNEDAVTRHPWANGEEGKYGCGAKEAMGDQAEEWFPLKEYLCNSL